MISAVSVLPISPATAPATVLLGLTAGMSLRLPKRLPTKYAAVSPSVGTRKDRHSSITCSQRKGALICASRHMPGKDTAKKGISDSRISSSFGSPWNST